MAQPAGFIPDGFEPDTPSTAAPPEGAVNRFVGGAWQNLNPMNLVSAAVHPIDTAKSLLAAHKAQFDKAKQAYDEGRYSEAIGHLGAAALPVLGPAAAAAGERIGLGDIAGGLGEAAGLIAAPRVTAAEIRALPAAARAMPAVARGAVRAGAAMADVVSPEVVGVVSPRAAHVLRVTQKLRDVIVEKIEKAKQPTPDQLATLKRLDQMIERAQQQEAASVVGPSAVPPAEPMAAPMAAGETPPAEAAPAAPTTRPNTINAAMEEAIAKHRAAQAAARYGPVETNVTHVSSGRVEPSRTYGLITTPVSLNEAARRMRSTAIAELKPTADEFQQGLRLIRQGKSADQVIDFIAAQRALKANLPTDAEVAATVAKKNVGKRDVAARRARMAGEGQP